VSVLLERPCDYPPNHKLLAVTQNDIGKGGVSWYEAHDPSLAKECLNRELIVDHSHDNIAVLGRERSIDNDMVAVIDAGIAHGLTPDTHVKGSVGLMDENVVKVDALLRMVLGGAGESTLRGGCYGPAGRGGRGDLSGY